MIGNGTKRTTLATIAEFTNGGAWSQSEYSTNGVPVVRVTDIKNETVDLSDCKFLPESSLKKYAKHLLRAGDLVICTVGSHPTQPGSVVGRAAVMPEIAHGALLNQNAVCIRSSSAEVDQSWLGYLGRSQTFHDYIIGCARGSANQVRMAIGLLKEMPVKVPPLPLQRRIADILSAYDELIENSQRRIRILESMARALYREWFVHFRFPGYENVRFVETHLGRVPEGWVLPFTDHVDFKEGPGLRNWQYRKEGLPFLNIRTLVGNDIDLSKVQFLDPKEVEDKYQHFLLREHDHVVSSSGTIGRIVTIRAEHLPLMLNTSIIRMRPQGKRLGCWQLKHFMLSDYFQDQAKSFATGAAQANFGPIHLKQMKIIAPDASTSGAYERLVVPMELAIMSLAKKIQNLRRTRDLLLPRLLSGQVNLSTNTTAHHA